MRRPDQVTTESGNRQSPSQVAPSTDRFPARPFTGLESAPAMGSRATRQGRSSGMSPAERGAAGMHGPVARLLRSFLAAGRSTTTWRDRGVWTGSGPVAGFLAFAIAGPVRRGAVDSDFSRAWPDQDTPIRDMRCRSQSGRPALRRVAQSAEPWVARSSRAPTSSRPTGSPRVGMRTAGGASVAHPAPGRRGEQSGQHPPDWRRLNDASGWGPPLQMRPPFFCEGR